MKSIIDLEAFAARIRKRAEDIHPGLPMRDVAEICIYELAKFQQTSWPLMPGDDVWFLIEDDVTGEVYTERDRVTGVGFEGFCCPERSDAPDSMGSPVPWSELGTWAFPTEAEAREAVRERKEAET